MTLQRNVVLKMFGIWLCLLSGSLWAQGVAVLDYPSTLILHPMMSTYSFEKGAFEKFPVGSTDQKYQEWIGRAGQEIYQLQEKYKADLSNRKALVQRLEAEQLRLHEKFNETLNSLSVNFDRMRSSDKAEDKALLARSDYNTKVVAFEEKYLADVKELGKKLATAKSELADLESLIESPRWTRPAETRQMFTRIETEILNVAQGIMRTKGCSVLLNSAGMGWPVPQAPLDHLDPAEMGHRCDLDLELYKAFLSGSVTVPNQDAPNPEYRQQVEAKFYQNKGSMVRRTLQARSGLRLVAEPDLAPRVLMGGVQITVDTVNYLLYQYRVSDLHRGLVAQVLRDMSLK